MTCTITALFESRNEAERARERLFALGVEAGEVDITDNASAGDVSAKGRAARDGTGSHGKGFLGALKDLFLPHDDRETYEEGLRRGHALLAVRADDDLADEIVDELEDCDAIDVDTRSQEWRQSGWEGPAAAGGARMQDTGMQSSTLQDSTRSTGAMDTGDRMRDGSLGEGMEERIPIVEEQLRVGKREVSRGGARVRSFVVETPVHEQVRLREERVTIDRRPVDAQATDADALFQDREIEVTETAEEAVVAKEARVREELVVRKDARERVEDIEETVRHTEVEIDDHLAQRETERNLREQDTRRPRT
jgi:uncharacterized protein (TIGR02271 family)